MELCAVVPAHHNGQCHIRSGDTMGARFNNRVSQNTQSTGTSSPERWEVLPHRSGLSWDTAVKRALGRLLRADDEADLPAAKHMHVLESICERSTNSECDMPGWQAFSMRM